MKKNYVSLKLQVVEVQLSDCIAGSNPVNVNLGNTLKQEVNETHKVMFDTW